LRREHRWNFGKRGRACRKTSRSWRRRINTGTIPSKTLRETALALSGMRSRKLFGVDLSLRREATVADFMRHKEKRRCPGTPTQGRATANI